MPSTYAVLPINIRNKRTASRYLRVGLSEGPFVLVEVLDEQVLPAELAVVAKVVHPLPPFEVHLWEGVEEERTRAGERAKRGSPLTF